MKAAVCERYGPPEVVQITEVSTPVPADDEVLVKGDAEGWISLLVPRYPRGSRRVEVGVVAEKSAIEWIEATWNSVPRAGSGTVRPIAQVLGGTEPGRSAAESPAGGGSDSMSRPLLVVGALSAAVDPAHP